MNKLILSFLWHMHQPYYRDMATGEATMPWVRLHGIHSYYDMLRLYRKFPNVNGTINFVPSLVEQLKAYVEGGKSDAFLDHTLVPAEELTQQQKIFILRHFFIANLERKIEPFGPYLKLYARLGDNRESMDFSQAVRFFSTQDYLDLQVFYNLVWFGFAAREEIPELRELLSMGGHFTEEHKGFVVETQKRILANLLEELKHASSSKNVEICTSPYFHPILPLLIDARIAQRADPKVALPPIFVAPHMARLQITKALDAMESWTGIRPRGMWPSEGSVCPEMIPMLAEAGVRWIATDDEILKKSLGSEWKTTNHFQPFKAAHDGKEVAVVFRNHGLSDLIGFTYSKLSAEKAVDDFVAHLERIEKGTKDDRCLVTVVLDGENPWEFYPDAGRDFLHGLFEAIGERGIETATIGRAIEKMPPTETIDDLHSGSWINANFDIWIGKPQKNHGWDYIRRTMEETGEVIYSGDSKAKLALESLAAACGSDWFWWFDDDFDSAFKGDFDRIFRTHLKNVFTFLGREIPLFLFDPIYRFEDENESILAPTGFIDPAIDGEESSFFEWANASVLSVHGRTSGAMAVNSTDPFETLSFGFNEKAFFIRIDPIDRTNGFSIEDEDSINITIHGKGEQFKYRVRMNGGTTSITKVGDDGSDGDAPGVKCASGDVLELSFDFAPLKLEAGDEATITITLSSRGIEIRRYSHIHFIAPDDTYEQRMWSV